jgi:hypothetical protein
MLSAHDDYPIHQTPDPIGQPAERHPNFYDRYWFNGYARDGEFYFGAALGLYPNRRVMDASFSIVKDGVQHSLHASRLAPDEPSETQVGPLRVEVLEPMRVVRVVVERNETGIEADLLFRPRTACIEEERAPMRRDRRVIMDTTRFAQFGSWEGRVLALGDATDVRPERVRATRDRSWGIRPVGEPQGGRPAGEPQIFFFWAPLHFDDVCTHAGSFESADGQPWDNFGWIVPAYEKPQAIPGAEDPAARRMLGVRHEMAWQPGTRWARSARLELLESSGESHAIQLEPLLRFHMLGLGYVHPEWGHGLWKGERALAGESWRTADLDPLDLRYRHVQQVVRARWGEREGVGVLEQIVFGPYTRYGFEHMMDGARG